MSYKKVFTALAISVSLSCTLMACSSDKTESSTTEESTEISEESFTDEEMFTDRDKDASYEESESVPITLSDNGVECDAKNVEISDSVVTIKAEGTYLLSGSLSNGQIVVDVEDTEKVQLVLQGATVNCDTSGAIYIKQVDKVFITLAEGTENLLSNKEEFVAIDDNNIDAVIFSKEDLTLNGTGSLTIQATYGHGIVSKDDLVLTGGNYQITAEKHGLSGKDSVRIADGSYNITCGKDAIHGENKDDETLGFVYISGGSFEIAADDDGIHAAANLVIDGGTVNISKSYEGLEGRTIDITDGEIIIQAEDDGMNAANGNSTQQNDFAADDSCYIKIAGGSIQINAYGDGIDSNGALCVNGGETYVSGAENDGNGALDYAGEAEITGGTFVATGMSGMAQNFGENSTQGSMLVNLSGDRTQEGIVLKDSDGNVIISYSPEKSYNSVLISHPNIEKDKTYTVETGTETATVEMSSLIYGSGTGMGGGRMQPSQDGSGTPPEQGIKDGGIPPEQGNEKRKGPIRQ